MLPDRSAYSACVKPNGVDVSSSKLAIHQPIKKGTRKIKDTVTTKLCFPIVSALADGCYYTGVGPKPTLPCCTQNTTTYSALHISFSE